MMGDYVEVGHDTRLTWMSADRDPVDLSEQWPFGTWTPGRWALRLENIRRLKYPVACKGKQAVPFTVPDDVEAAVLAQLRGLRV